MADCNALFHTSWWRDRYFCFEDSVCVSIKTQSVQLWVPIWRKNLFDAHPSSIAGG